MTCNTRIIVWAGFLAVSGLFSGCSVLGTKPAGNWLTESREDSVTDVKLVYRTDSDRISFVSNGLLDELAGPLTAASECRLTIVHPHPQLGSHHAQATLDLVPDRGGDVGSNAVWQMPVPTQQLNDIFAKLKEENFFERSRPWRTESHLDVEFGDNRFGKRFTAVAGLDAMMTRALRQRQSQLVASRATIQPTASAVLPLRRLPFIQ